MPAAALCGPSDQNVFEVLARPPARAAVDVAAETLLETEDPPASRISG